MPDRSIRPPDPRFKPYMGPPARARSADGSIFYAQLGSIGDDKTTFHVYVWMEHTDGTVIPIPVVNPPNNQSTLTVEAGHLLLTGPLNGAIVERVIPGFVVPVPTTALDATARQQAAAAAQTAQQALAAIADVRNNLHRV